MFLFASDGPGGVENILNSEYVQLDFYLDQGFVRATAGHLYKLKRAPDEPIIEALLSDSLCGGAFQDNWIGCVIEQGSNDSAFLNSICLLYVDFLYLDQSYAFQEVVKNMFPKREFEISRDDSVYKITYSGTELKVDGSSIKKFKTADGKHVISFSTQVPRYTIVFKKEPSDLKGYKPLRLDPSILPLESPGYKKLREQEEALK